MAAENVLQTLFTRLGFEIDTKALEEYQSKVVDLSKKLLEFTGVASLSVGGLFALTRESTAHLADVQRLSDTYGIATEALATFNSMGQTVGITTDSMEQSIGHLSTAMGGVAIGQGRFLTKILEKYGLTVKDANGQIKDMHTFLGDVAERMKTLSSFEQNLLVKRLGLDPGMVRLLRNGRDEFDKLYGTVAKGLPFKAEDYKKAEDFEAAFRQVRSQLKNITTDIGLSLMPMFQRAMDMFLTWWRANGERVMERIHYWVTIFGNSAVNVLAFMSKLTGHTNILSDAMKVLGVALAIVVGYKLASWAKAGADMIVGLWKNVTLLIKYYEGLATAEEEAAAAGLIMNLEIWAVIAAIAILAAAIYLIIDDFETWRKGGISAIGAIINWFQKMAASSALFKVLYQALGNMWTVMKDLWERAGSAIEQAWAQIRDAFAAFWPMVKPTLIFLAVALGIVIYLTFALAAAAIWMAAKFVTALADIAEFFGTLFSDPTKAIANITNWINSIISWIFDQLPRIAAAFQTVFDKVFDAIGKLFLSAVAWMVDTAINMLDKVSFGLASKIGIKTENVDTAVNKWKAQLDSMTKKGIEQQRKVDEAHPGAPAGRLPVLPPTGATISPAAAAAMRASGIGMSPATVAAIRKGAAVHSIDESKTNSDNTVVHANITVKSPEEAAQAVSKIQDDSEKRKNKRQQHTFQTAIAPA